MLDRLQASGSGIANVPARRWGQRGDGCVWRRLNLVFISFCPFDLQLWEIASSHRQKWQRVLQTYHCQGWSNQICILAFWSNGKNLCKPGQKGRLTQDDLVALVTIPQKGSVDVSEPFRFGDIQLRVDVF